jgi:hypothetical protein
VKTIKHRKKRNKRMVVKNDLKNANKQAKGQAV